MPKSLSLHDIENLSQFDLNLIIVFELIYRHHSIAKAAVSLGISSSAVSQSLKKLREYFEDPLFIKSQNTLAPTILSEHIHSSLLTNLSALNNIISVGLHEIERKTFTIYSPPTVISLMAPELGRFSREENFLYEIIHHNIYSTEGNIEDLFNYRKADIAIALTPVFNSYLTCEAIESKRLVLVCNNNYNKIGEIMNAEELTAHKWIATVVNDAFLQMEIANFYRNTLKGERDVIFSSDSILPILSALENFDGIGIISEEMFNMFGQRFNLRIIPTSFAFASYTYHIIYRTSMAKDIAFCKMRDAIKAVLNTPPI